MPNHLEKTKIGVLWSFVNQGGAQFLNLLITFILARLVTPDEFGTIAMITVFTGFAIRFVDFGFSAALIQKKEVSKEDVDTVFFFNLTSGILLTGLFFFLSPLIADFYQVDSLNTLTKVLSFIFIITASSGVNKALITKAINFKLNAFISLAALVLSSGLAIVLAYKGFGVWSILVKILSQEVFTSLLFFIFYPVNQKPKFNRESFDSMFKMGRNVAGESIINYWSRNADNLLIGKMLSSGALGLYSKAYAIMMLPLTNFSRVIARVMFPSFSLIQDDIPEIKRIYLNATKVIAFLTFPMMGGLAVVSKEFVLSTFGPDWKEMIPLVSILSILGASQSILSLNGVIYNSLNKTHIAFRISLIFGLFNVIGFYVGIKLNGLMGLVIIYTTIGIVGAIPNFYYAGRLINISVNEILKNLSQSFFLTLVMVGLIYVFKLFLVRFDLTPLLSLIILVTFGFLSYLGMAVLLKVEEYELAKKLLKNNKAKK